MSTRKRRLPFIAACAAVLIVISGTSAGAEPPPGTGEDDTTAPVIRVQAPEGAWQGWYREPAAIRISATDTGGSGVQNVDWTITGAQPGTGNSNGASTTVMISNQGVSEFAITATDFEGNTSTAKYGVGIDTVAPQIALGGTATDNMVIERGAKRTITYSCTDNLTGVHLCTGDFVTGAEVPSDTLGQKKVEMRALDKVQNRSTKTINYTVVESALQPVVRPTISGRAHVGQTLTANGGTFTPAADSVSYQWLRNGEPVGTGPTYALSWVDFTKNISVVATGRKAGFGEAVSPSTSTSGIKGPLFTIIGDTTLEGTPAVGSTLRVGLPTISPTPTTISYEWYRAGDRIAGADSREYRLTPDDAGKSVQARVWIAAENLGYESQHLWAPESEPVQASALEIAQVPKVTGTPRVGRTLTATAPTFTPAASSVTRQWLRNGVAIRGATGSTYKLTTSDLGRQVSVRFVGSRAQYADTPATSVATARTAKATPSITTSTKARGKKRVRVSVRVQTTGFTPSGRVTIKRGSKVVARNKSLKGGRVTVNLTRQKKGVTRYTIVYAGTPSTDARTVRTSKVRVR